MQSMIEAMERGWTVTEVARVLASGRNDEDRGYLVTLANHRLHATRRLYVPHSPESTALLDFVKEKPLAL